MQQLKDVYAFHRYQMQYIGDALKDNGVDDILGEPNDDCPYCEGTGRTQQANGPDDYQEVNCDCTL